MVSFQILNMGKAMLIPFDQNVPSETYIALSLQIHRICLSLQALEFLTSGLEPLYFTEVQRGAKPPVQEHRANLWQDQGLTQGRVLSLPRAFTS